MATTTMKKKFCCVWRMLVTEVGKRKGRGRFGVSTRENELGNGTARLRGSSVGFLVELVVVFVAVTFD